MSINLKSIVKEPTFFLIAGLVSLLALLLVSLIFSGIDFENYQESLKPFPLYLSHLNDIIAIGIGFTQALIIIICFMDLKNARPMWVTVFFVSLLITFCLTVFAVSQVAFRDILSALESIQLTIA